MELSISTQKRCEVVDVTRAVREACRKWGKSGLVHLYCPHTTAGLAVNENADPTVKGDILSVLERACPKDGPYAHGEGNADAHAKAVLVGGDVTLAVRAGTLLLGRWQGIYFMEFDGPRSRSIWATFLAGNE